jgi:hypothetical protein
MAFADVAIAPPRSFFTEELHWELVDLICKALDSCLGSRPPSQLMTTSPLALAKFISSTPPPPTLLASPIDLPLADETDSCSDCSLVDEPPLPADVTV